MFAKIAHLQNIEYYYVKFELLKCTIEPNKGIIWHNLRTMRISTHGTPSFEVVSPAVFHACDL